MMTECMKFENETYSIKEINAITTVTLFITGGVIRP